MCIQLSFHNVIVYDYTVIVLIYIGFHEIYIFFIYAYLWNENACKAHMRLFFKVRLLLRCAYFWVYTVIYLYKQRLSESKYVTHIFTARPLGLETWNLAERWAFGRRWTKIHKSQKMLPWQPENLEMQTFRLYLTMKGWDIQTKPQ